MRIRSSDVFGQTVNNGNKSDISLQGRCKGQRTKAGKRSPGKQCLWPVRNWSSGTALRRGSQEDWGQTECRREGGKGVKDDFGVTQQ